MIERVTFKGVAGDSRELRTEIECIDVRLDRSVISVALVPHRHAPFDRPCNETREEYGYRLRRAAAEAGRYIEEGILAEMRRMGHLV